MIGEALRDDRAAHALAFEVDLGDEIDLPLLGDIETGLAPRKLDFSGAQDDFGGCREKDRIWQGTYTGLDPLGLDTLDHHEFHAALGRAPQHHFVHETANEEDAAAA